MSETTFIVAQPVTIKRRIGGPLRQTFGGVASLPTATDLHEVLGCK